MHTVHIALSTSLQRSSWRENSSRYRQWTPLTVAILPLYAQIPYLTKHTWRRHTRLRHTHNGRVVEAVVTNAVFSPDITGEAWFTAKVPSRPSRVLFKLKRLLINSKWQCPSMATLLSISPSASPSSGAWRTCARASSGNSARSRIITRQWRTAATSHGEGVATFSTVPLQYAANCFPSISRLTDTVGSMLSSHPRSCTNRPKLSGDLPNLQAISSKIFFTDLHQVGSLSSVKFPSSTCFSQCLFERCSELHSAHSHFQQLNSGRKNHGRCIDSTCLRKRFFDTPQMTHRAAVRSPPLSFSSPALSSTATTLLSSSALSSTVTTLLSSCTFSTATEFVILREMPANQCYEWVPYSPGDPLDERMIATDSPWCIVARLQVSGNDVISYFVRGMDHCYGALEDTEYSTEHGYQCERLRVVEGCTIFWVPYTAGGPLPSQAVIGGSMANGEVPYVVKYDVIHNGAVDNIIGNYIEGGTHIIGTYGGEPQMSVTMMVMVVLQVRHLSAVTFRETVERADIQPG